MIRRVAPSALLLFVFLLCDAESSGQFVAPQPNQPSTLNGYTDVWDGRNYRRLTHVKIEIIRDGNFVKTFYSDESSYYNIRLKSTGPVNVIYHMSKEFVPELQSLSTRPGANNTVCLSLISVQTYRDLERQGRVPPLKEKLAAILSSLPKQEDNPQIKQLRRELEDLLAEEGQRG